MAFRAASREAVARLHMGAVLERPGACRLVASGHDGRRAMRQNGHVDLIGTSPAITELKAEVERVARSDAKVLITGESGVGQGSRRPRHQRRQPARRISAFVPSTAPAFRRRCSSPSCSAT